MLQMHDRICMKLLNRWDGGVGEVSGCVGLGGKRKKKEEAHNDSVVARVGLDLALDLHVDARGGDGAAFAEDDLRNKWK